MKRNYLRAFLNISSFYSKFLAIRSKYYIYRIYAIITNVVVIPARAVVLVEPYAADHIALIVTMASGSAIKSRMLRVVKELEDLGFRTIVLAVSSRLELETGDIGATGVVVRTNNGFDFCAWKFCLDQWPFIWDSEKVIFLNDSVFVSQSEFGSFIKRARDSQSDIFAATDSVQIRPHFQSYFFCYSAHALDRMKPFWKQVRPQRTKWETTMQYEVPQMQFAAKTGLSVEIAAPTVVATNPTLAASALDDKRHPFVKVALLRHSTLNEHWQAKLLGRGFNVDEIEQELSA